MIPAAVSFRKTDAALSAVHAAIIIKSVGFLFKANKRISAAAVFRSCPFACP